MPAAARDRDGKAAALSVDALDADGAAVQPRQFLDQGEADAGAFVDAPARALDAVEAIEDSGQVALANPDAGVPDGELDGLAGPAEGEGDGALEGEFERVGEEVEDNLLPHFAVHVDGVAERRAIDGEGEAGALDGGAEDAGEAGGEAGEVDGLVAGLDASRFDAGEIEEVVDELEKALGVAVDEIEFLAGDGGVLASEQLFEGAKHEGEGSPKLMAHVAEEGGFGAVELGQGLGAAALVLVCFGFGDGGGDLGAGELEKSAVGVVQPLPGAHAGDQKA